MHACLAIFGQIDLSLATFLLGKIMILTVKGVAGVWWLKMLEWFGSGVRNAAAVSVFQSISMCKR